MSTWHHISSTNPPLPEFMPTTTKFTRAGYYSSTVWLGSWPVVYLRTDLSMQKGFEWDLIYHRHSDNLWAIWRVSCQKQVSRAGTSNYIPQYLWDVIFCPYPKYLLLAQHSWYILYHKYIYADADQWRKILTFENTMKMSSNGNTIRATDP